MPIVQLRKLVPRDVLRHVTLSCAILGTLGACADKAEEAAAAGVLAQQQLQGGNLPGARKSINDAIAARDDNVELHLLRAQIELAAGSLGAAYDAFSDALALDPANPNALQGVSQLGLQTGHAGESLQATERILAIYPNQPDALLTRGIHALVRRRYDDAIEYADRILAARPDNENASVLKARALFMQGEVDAALAAVNQTEVGSADSVAVALTKLEIFRELRRPADMSEQFARLRRIQPQNLALRLDEANLRFKLGDFGRANRLVVEVLANPDLATELADAAIDLWREYGTDGLGATQLNRVLRSASEGSRQRVARFLIEDSSFEQASIFVGSLAGDERASLAARLLAAERSFEPALEAANRVLARDETQCDALIAHSEATLGSGKATAALASGQRAAAECPEQVEAWLAAAAAYQSLGRQSGVERVYSQAFDAHSQSTRIGDSYAEWLLREKRTREAVAIARRLTRNAPALLSGWRHYAEVCRIARSDCSTEAERGLANARTSFGVDLKPGAAAPNGLVGRLVRR